MQVEVSTQKFPLVGNSTVSYNKLREGMRGQRIRASVFLTCNQFHRHGEGTERQSDGRSKFCNAVWVKGSGKSMREILKINNFIKVIIVHYTGKFISEDVYLLFLLSYIWDLERYSQEKNHFYWMLKMHNLKAEISLVILKQVMPIHQCLSYCLMFFITSPFSCWITFCSCSRMQLSPLQLPENWIYLYLSSSEKRQFHIFLYLHNISREMGFILGLVIFA